MKTLFALVVVAVIVNAVYRCVDAGWKFYQWKDGAYQALTLGVDAPTEQLQQKIVRTGADLKLPVSAERVTVTRQGVRTYAAGSYHQDIEVFPGYRYPYDFDFNVEVTALR